MLLASLMAVQTAAFAPINPSVSQSRSYNTNTNTNLYAATAQLAEGLTKTITKEGDGQPLRLGDVATVSYNCYLSATKQPFAKSNKQKVVIGDGVMIEGFEKALSTMSVGERCLVTVTDSQKFGYGKDGVSPLIPPHAELEMEIEVFDAEEQKNMGVAGVVVTGMSGSGDLGNLDPSKPVSQS